MNFSSFKYEPTDIDDELFLSEVPLGLLEKAIDAQFANPLEYRKKDYLQSFITKYNFSKENIAEEDQNDIDMMNDDFISYMISIFKAYLSIGFPNIEDMDTDDQHRILHLTYRFFIKNIKKNFTNIIINYIELYKEDIVTSDYIIKKKDVTTLNFKSEIDNEDDIIILSNLDKIIENILYKIKDSYNIDDFFNLLCSNNENCLETEFVKTKFEEFEITGNFISDYINIIDSDFQNELESKIRNKILKKYPMRKSDLNNLSPDKKVEPETTDSDG